MKTDRLAPILVCSMLLLLGALRRTRADELAALTGRITDSQGLVVPSVRVEAVNINTNVGYSSETNGDGLYRIPEVPPGMYRIIVQKVGFAQIVKPGVELHVQDVITLNFTIRLGSVSETVTVEGGAPLVNTESGSVGTVIDRNLISQLPLNGRSFNTLLQLTPGVVIVGSSQVTSPGQFSVNGQRTDANYFQVDGVSVNFGITTQTGSTGSYGNGAGGSQAFNAFGGTSSLVSVDAMQEFRVETSSFAPEYGHAPGGQVMIETRSGTNDFHGGIFDYFRNTVLDANNWFNNAATQPIPRAPEHQNDFGGFFGGRIRRNRTFFFLSYEGLRLLQPQTRVVNVPSQLARTSATSAAAPYLDAYPQPNGTASASNPYVAPFTGSYGNRIIMDATSFRLDQVISSRWTLFGRFNYAPSQTVSHSIPPSQIDTTKVNTATLTIGVAGAFTTQITNSLRANYSEQSGGTASQLTTFGGAVPPTTELLLPPPLSSAAGFAQLAIRGVVGYQLGTQSHNREYQVNLLDSVSLNLGKHQVRVGVDYRRLKYSQSGEPAFLFAGANSVQSFASTAQINRLFYETFLPSHIQFPFFSAYAQDSWKIGQRFTATYGLRWEFNPPPSGTNGTTLAAWGNTDTPENTVLAPPHTPLWKTQYANLAPRIGAAYRLSPTGDFIVRGGWGIFYDLGTGTAPLLAATFPNFGITSVFQPISMPIANVSQYAPVISSQPPYSFGANGFSSHLSLPRSYQWNIAVEKSFQNQQSMSVTYLGQIGRDLLREISELQPNSNFGPGSSFNLTTNGDTSNYNALQLQYRRPVSQQLQALLNYTWSHCIDTNSQDALPVPTGSGLSAHGDRGVCDFDNRHNFTGSVTYNLPTLTKLPILSQMEKNWSLDAVAQVRSGFPINVTYFNLTIPGVVPFLRVRPDLVSGVPIWLYGAQYPAGKALNPRAFDSVTPQASGRQGNLGRNAVSGFGASQFDLSVMRKFRLAERANLQFRADIFNLINHPSFANPDSNLSDGALFGVATQTLNAGLGGLTPLYQIGGPRSIQLSLKLLF